MRTSSFPSRSMTPFDQGQYGSVKRCGTFSPFLTSLTVSLRKCVGPSDINADGAPNAADQSMFADAAFLASVLGKT